jgi:hypothetical protein
MQMPMKWIMGGLYAGKRMEEMRTKNEALPICSRATHQYSAKPTPMLRTHPAGSPS